MDHLVYCDKKSKVLEKIINKTKTMIVRGAAGRKLPHSRVFPSDTLYLVENDGNGLIKAKATVKSVFNSDKLTVEESNKIIEDNMDKLNLTPMQIKRWSGKRYLCLVEIENVEEIEPLKYDRQSNMDDWITVESIESILEGSNNNYQSIRL